ncbi:MAG: hypothetical protein HZA36_01365 [Parcubacteria group bacterium]|nr:hypothetical protein [Parcubacteria group bacterium]
MPYKDIIKRRACHKRYYARNRQLYRQKNIKRRNELIDFVVAFKQKPCMDCGITYPPYVMDFDHRDRKTKVASINEMINLHSYSKDKILAEINKCDLVCANCHRIRTYCGIV